MLPIPAHFHQAGHTVSQRQFQGIEHIPPARRGSNRIQTLKRQESFWIHTLQTLEPQGLNREYDRLSL